MCAMLKSESRYSLALVAMVAAWLVSVCDVARADLTAEIETTLAEESLAGISWMLIGDGGEVSLGAAGLRDIPSQTAFTIDTRFHVGSLTKSLLATGVLRLATEGMIELDAPASRYLPGLHFDNPWSATSRVTVRHLLDHTAGLNDAQLWQMFSLRPTPDTELIEAFPEPETQLRIRSRPGARFSYSNMGYTLLGMVIESVVGGRYETYLDQNVLAPLAMHDSTFAFTTQEGENADPRLAWGHVDDGSRYAASPIFLRPAGQFTTTAADLARFGQFLLGDGWIDGWIDGRPFIDEALMRSRGRPSGTEAANSGLVAGYALGLGRRDRHGVVSYCHGGNIVGFVAMLCIFPDEKKAFAYSVNTDSETADYGRLDALFIGSLSIAKLSPPPTASPAADTAQWHGWYTLRPNRFGTFEYLDDVFGAVHVTAEGDSLVLSPLQQGTRQLRPLGGHVFSANDRETESHVLVRGEQGEYLVSDGFRTFQKVSTAYLAAHWISVFLGLTGLAWLIAAGAISLIRHRAGLFRQVVAPSFLASALLVLPIPFLMAQSFMALGDVTVASVLLATVTLMLPFGMLMTIIRAIKKRKSSWINLIHGLAAVFVLQWCAVLVVSGLLPLRLWIL